MMLIDSKKFHFSFFLSDRKKVASLEEGARLYGGATQLEDGIYSNYQKSEFIGINEKNNNISLFVPSTVNISQHVNNRYFLNYCYNKLRSLYINIRYYNTRGSWWSDEKNDIVTEEISIITVQAETITENDIYNFIQLANWIKKEMSQEGVTIMINAALAIV